MNRADPELVAYMQYSTSTNQLIDNCREVLGQPLLYKDVIFPTAPHTEVTAKGDIVYTEIVRENVRKLEAYVEEMASGDTITAPTNIQKIQDDVLKLWNVVKSQPEISEKQRNRIKALFEGVFLRPQVSSVTSITADKVPLLKVGTNWEYSSNLVGVYLAILHEIATSGATFKDKNTLLTGVGKGVIGVEILKGLLSGGAHAAIIPHAIAGDGRVLQDVFRWFGSKGSALTVGPFNQGSEQDVKALVDYIYSTLGLTLDYILLFIENRCEISLDDKSELAHHIMLVNLLQLVGAVKESEPPLRNSTDTDCSATMACTPSLGSLWKHGVNILTLRGRCWLDLRTGLMDATNMVAHDVESHGVHTLSAKEMVLKAMPWDRGDHENPSIVPASSLT
ncbi:Fatty acid synthase subunit alpha [Grifola frondosa]|uniref:Fatty acid synthase subunit alpha n=1 Tax=Grifola frondosa TaxID=5627 RepID=A0A1C7MM11_GRIFR|nr:Fatty acid synthase subunit alpha [Grifola frondosa]